MEWFTPVRSREILVYLGSHVSILLAALYCIQGIVLVVVDSIV